MIFPKHILFLFKRKNTNIESKHWNKKEFYFLEFNTIPEEYKDYFQESSSSKEKSTSSKEKSTSSKEKSTSSKEKSSSSKEKSSSSKEKSTSSKEKSSSSSKEKSTSSSKEKSSSSSKEKSSSSKDYDKLKVNELKSLCRERNIPLKSYVKSYLIEKLNQYDKKSKTTTDKKSKTTTDKKSKTTTDNKSKTITDNKLYFEKTVSELIKLCRERGISLRSYNKKYIIERLEEFDRNPNMKVKKKKTRMDKLKQIFKKK